LTPGDHYDFKVSAINFNGEGPQSTVPLSTYSCTAPVGVLAPTRVASSSTATTTALSWQEPTDTGGCPLTGYALYRSDPSQADAGAGTEVFVEVNSDNDANIRDQPDLLEATVTYYDAASTGLEFKYRVEAINAIGGTIGTSVSYILATIPSAPSLAPVLVPASTSST
jgi:titin